MLEIYLVFTCRGWMKMLVHKSESCMQRLGDMRILLLISLRKNTRFSMLGTYSVSCASLHLQLGYLGNFSTLCKLLSKASEGRLFTLQHKSSHLGDSFWWMQESVLYCGGHLLMFFFLDPLNDIFHCGTLM